MSFDLSNLKPGQSLLCVIEKAPRTEDDESTLMRLMRRDPSNKKALRRAQTVRRQRMNVYNRGNRDWVSREKPALVVRAVPGEKFTLPFTFDALHDLNLVAKYMTIRTES